MDLTVFSIIATIIVVAIIGTMKYFERKYGTNPEAWDNNKFLTFLAIAIVVIAFEYYLGGAIEFPEEGLINQAAAVFGITTALLSGGRIVRRAVIPAVAGTPAPTAATWYPGFTATPTFTEIKSGQSVTFHLNAGNDQNSNPIPIVEIDWMDGTPKQVVKLVNHFAEVAHTFIYVQGTSKYTGHSFYPEFTIVAADGARQSFNVDGRMVEVEVQSV